MKAILGFLCFIFRLLPRQNKIVMCSRQSDSPSIDFLMLSDELEKQGYKVVIICRFLKNNPVSAIRFAWANLRQAYHVSRAKAAVLDTYCIPVCMLKKDPNLKVIQIWHAMGALKKFGYSILDNGEGRSSELSKMLGMHANYDCITVSSNEAAPFLMEAYGYDDPDKIFVCPLPRYDYIKDKSNRLKLEDRLFSVYPELDNGRKTVLYAPTFRKVGEPPYKKIVENCNLNEYNLIVKFHDGTEKIYVGKRVFERNSGFNGFQSAVVADYIICDYSALIFECMLTEKPIFLYTGDFEEYNDKRGFYIDFDSIPLFKSNNCAEIFQKISENSFIYGSYREFIDRMITPCSDATKRLANHIVGMIDNGTEMKGIK